MKELPIILLFIFSINTNVFAKEQTIYEIDEIATASAPWEANSIIPNSRKLYYPGGTTYSYCKFLGVTPKGYYLVQEFYDDIDKKTTDPYTIIITEGRQQSNNSYFSCSSQKIDGAFIIWYPQGENKFIQLSYKDGVEEGLYTQWSKEGTKWIEGHFKNTVPDGLWISWHDDGQKKKEGYYVNGKKDGLWLTWHENGQKESESRYKNDIKDGLWLERDRNGAKIVEGRYINNKKNGMWSIEDFGNKSGGHYKNDVKEGKWVEIKVRNYISEDTGNYVNGKKEGPWQTKNLELENEFITITGSYKDNEKDGPWKISHENGQFYNCGSYKNGKKVGVWKTISPTYDGGEYIDDETTRLFKILCQYIATSITNRTF